MLILVTSYRYLNFVGTVLLVILICHTESCAGGQPEFLLKASTHAVSGVNNDDADTGTSTSSGDMNPLVTKPLFSNSTSSRSSTFEPSAPDFSVAESLLPTPVSEQESPDWSGITRDTALLFSSQVVAAGIIYTLPNDISNWSDEQKKNSFNKYLQNIADPVIDKDKFYINYILHPYWGATYYIRARERGLDTFPAFVYSAMISAMYEFGVECFFEKPSIQDLIVTPVFGSLLGAFVFEPWRQSIKRKQELRWYDHAALIATDPVGVLSLGFEKIFGIKSTIMVDFSVPQMQKRTAGPALSSSNSSIGVVFKFAMN